MYGVLLFSRCTFDLWLTSWERVFVSTFFGFKFLKTCSSMFYSWNSEKFYKRLFDKKKLRQKAMTSSVVRFLVSDTHKMHTKSLSLSHAKSTRKFYCGCYSFLSVCAPCKRCKHRLSFFIFSTNSTTFARSLIQISRSIVSSLLCVLKVKYHVGVISSV